MKLHTRICIWKKASDNLTIKYSKLCIVIFYFEMFKIVTIIKRKFKKVKDYWQYVLG